MDIHREVFQTAYSEHGLKNLVFISALAQSAFIVLRNKMSIFLTSLRVIFFPPVVQSCYWPALGADHSRGSEGQATLLCFSTGDCNITSADEMRSLIQL